MTERELDDLARRVMLDAARQEYGEAMDEPPEHDFSPAFEREMEKLVRRADHPTRWRWIWAGRIAATLAVLLALATAAAAAAGCNLWELLVQWTDEQIWIAPGQIDPVDEDAIHIPTEPKVYADIHEALDDYGFTRPVAPQWLPEGFEMDELIADQFTEDELVFNVLYKRGDVCIVFYTCIYLDNEGRTEGLHSNFQKDEGDPVPYDAGGITHLLATNAGRPVAVWSNGPAECAISGDITMDELKAILDSIYEAPTP